MNKINYNRYEAKDKKEVRFSRDFILLAGVTTLGDLLMAAVLLK